MRKRIWRPRLRFGLRTALIGLTVFCVWLGYYVHTVRKQRAAVEVIQADGGWVGYDFAWQNGDWKKGGDSWAPGWLTDIFGIDAIHSVVAVNLPALFHSQYDGNRTYMGHDPEAFVSDEVWRAIENLKSTEWLSLNARNISDDELQHLSGLKKLNQLKLEGVPIDGSGLKYLVVLPRLQHLTLSRVHLKDEHAPWIAQFKHLQDIGLSQSTISPEVAADLEKKVPWCKHYYDHWPPTPDPSDTSIGFRIYPSK